MEFHLVVTSPFGPYRIGEVITEPDTVSALLASHADRVLKIIPPQEG